MNTDLKLLALYEKLHSEVEAVERVRGEKGDTGPQGPKGDKGDKGDVGPVGKTGKDGVDGKSGKDGKPGKDGEDGVSVVDANVDIDNHLVITLSDGKEVDAGSLEGLGGKGSSNLQVINSGTNGGIQSAQDTYTWIDYATGYSTAPTLLQTIPSGDVYEYTYGTKTLYRLVGTSEDSFYETFGNPSLSDLVISKGITI
jgi:hypothetical protein